METFTERFGDEDEYEVSLEIEPGHTQGWVINTQTGFSASLAALDTMGCLTKDDASEDVDSNLIADMMNWAEEQGY